MIRGLKGLAALTALAGLGLALRWMTASTYGEASSHDLDSLTVLAVATVAWMAYGWLALAVTTTVLEQLPGAIGTAASAVATRITSHTARTLLRSTLGLAAVTPLTIGAAHAAPGDGTTNDPWLEPRSSLQPAATTANASTWRTTEPPSTVRLTGSDASPRTQVDVRRDARAHRVVPAEPQRTASQPGGARVRIGVPDRPTAGAATRYTDLRSGQPVRVPRRVVVKPGDTLWSIAATELGGHATPQDVASRWPAWYAANRRLIGPDPDLIRPGQVLRIPPPATGNPVPPTHQEK
ncbi:LysM peptidoglycan-binding domain-containing protein [Kribbella sp. NPDC050124]|uniref:LysM peptidoglycan-binding domain-containing protein n=1 Tax=Kribbella sp. NPDC050124 TaxID=3364114 RepID=UPI003796520B